MTTIAFAVLPPSLLPESLARAMLDPEVAVVATKKDPMPAEGMSVVWASNKAANTEAVAPNPRAKPTLEDAEDDVVEVQLTSSASTPSLETMTVKQLKAFAAEEGVSLQGTNTKKQILQKLKA